MIQKRRKNDINFDTFGIKALAPKSAIITEEINGLYSLEMVFSSSNFDLECEDIVSAPTPYGVEQAFRIYSVKRSIVSADIEVRARHIFYDLLDNFIEVIHPTLKNGQEALDLLLNSTNFQHNFVASSDIEKHWAAYWELKNPIEAIIGDESNSFVNRWGGELYRNNFEIIINKNHSQAEQHVLLYSKNLQECGLEYNIENVVTRIMPTGLQENGQTILKLPEKFIDSENIELYQNPKVKRIHYSNIQAGSEEYPTQADAFEGLRQAVALEYEKNIDAPQISGTLSIIDLSKTEEYKNLLIFEKINPFDEVKIRLENGLSATSKMVRYSFNCLTEEYESIEFGDVKQVRGQDLFSYVQRNIKGV